MDSDARSYFIFIFKTSRYISIVRCKYYSSKCSVHVYKIDYNTSDLNFCEKIKTVYTVHTVLGAKVEFRYEDTDNPLINCGPCWLP
jgi:hypothetical protein